MILVVHGNNLVYFCHLESLGNTSTWVQVHQGALLGYCQDEGLGHIYSIGNNEPAIKKFKVENNVVTALGIINAPRQI